MGHIESVGIQNNKAEYLYHSANMIKREFGGEVPRNVLDLMRLPGVGEKIAFLTMQLAHNE